MREYELEVLEQYHIEVLSTRKIRGAFFCDTNHGPMVLSEVMYAEKRAPYYYMICKQLEESGFDHVDTIVPTAGGKFLSVSRDGKHYALKKWFRGNECDVKNERDITQATQNLAKLHLVMHWRAACDLNEQMEIVPLQGVNLIDTFTRHNQEMVKVRRFIRKQPVKHEFEELFLKNFEPMYQQAQNATTQLKQSGYDSIYGEAVTMQTMVHGDYNYHNIILQEGKIATTNFEHARIDIQVSDLAYFVRKVMEKQHWRSDLGKRILVTYESVRPLTKLEKEYIRIRLSYPEKFWKIVNSYYLSNKSWISAKMVEKLYQTINETEEKKIFLKNVIS